MFELAFYLEPSIKCIQSVCIVRAFRCQNAQPHILQAGPITSPLVQLYGSCWAQERNTYLHPEACHMRSSLSPTQASKMGDVRLKQHISEALAAYHPFWLRLGLEIIAGKAVPPADGSTSRLHSSRAELEAFAREHFLNDADLAQQRAGNRALGTLHGDAYWVQGPLNTPLAHPQTVAWLPAVLC